MPDANVRVYVHRRGSNIRCDVSLCHSRIPAGTQRIWGLNWADRPGRMEGFKLTMRRLKLIRDNENSAFQVIGDLKFKGLFSKQFHYPLHGEKTRIGLKAAARPVKIKGL